MHKPVKYLVLIDSADGPVARLFDESRAHVLDIDATSEEVADMTGGHTPVHGALGSDWNDALGAHTHGERQAAQIFTLEI